MSYTPPDAALDASWVGAPEYHAPYSVVPGAWGATAPTLYPVGIPAGQVGTPPLVTQQQFAGPAGWASRAFTDPLVTLEGEYVPPYAEVSGLWTGAAEYTPPTRRLDAAWQEAQPGDDQYVYGAGFDALGFGGPFVTQQQFLAPIGWGGEVFGRVRANRPGEYLPPYAELHADWIGAADYIPPAGFILARWGDTAANAIRPVGADHARIGRPSLFNQHRWVLPKGWDSFQGFGEHWVSLGTRRINAGMGDQSAFGLADLAGGTRWLDLAGRGIAASTYGRATVWFHSREVFPGWFIATLYGRPMVDHHHGVEPEGWDSSAFGRPDVHVPRDYVDLAGLGIAGPLWGEHTARNAVEYLHPNGIGPWPGEHERFGRPELQLWTRYIHQLFEVTPDDGGAFGNFNYVENRDKVPRPEGWLSSRFGTAEVFNNARIITTPPHQDMSLWGDTLVAWRIREITPQGFDAVQWGSPLGNIVYNAARVLAPEGFDAGAPGTPERVWSNLQWMDHAGGDDLAGFGDAMVAFAIRTVAPYSLPEPPSAGLPTVQNRERYIEPPGIDAGRHGVPTLEEHFTIVAPKSVLPLANQVGDGSRVWNRTPELQQMGAEHAEWGRAAVFNEWEAYEVQGFRSTMWGRHTVRDRRSWIEPRSVQTLIFGPRTEVRNVDPDPPGPQTIETRADTVMSAYGRHSVSSNVVFHNQSEAFTSYGRPQLVYMGFTPRPILPPYDPDTGSQFGIPKLPRAQIVAPTDVRAGEPWTDWGAAHLWPHTIWAPRGYPYTTGKELERGHIMDAENPPERRPGFGRAAVTLQNRVVRHRHNTTDDGVFTRFGEQRFSLNPQYIQTEWQHSHRFGVPDLGGGDRELEHYGREHTEFGNTTVTYAPSIGPQTVQARGAAQFGAGRPVVEFFHREVAPRGFDSFQISPPRPPSWPRQSHWVSNAYPPFEIPGFDATEWGTTWVSHFIRHLEPAGWDSATVADYEPGHFSLRMRVRRDDYVRGAGAGLQGGFGAADVTHGTRGMLVRAIYDGRPGTPAVRAVWMVDVPGWDSQAFGDIDRWEAGKVKAHGEDLAAFGKAILHRALHPDSITGAVGAPRVGHVIGPAGADTSDVPPPTLIAFVCGTRARAIPGFDALGMGIPQVGEQVAAALEPGEIRPAGWLATNQTAGVSLTGHAVRHDTGKTGERV